MASVAGEGEEVNQVAIIGGAVLAEIGEFRGAHANEFGQEGNGWFDCFMFDWMDGEMGDGGGMGVKR